MRTTVKRSRLTLVCVFLALPLFAQTPASSGPGAPYASEPIVVVRLDSVADMHADGTGVKTRIGVVRVQSDATLKQFSVLSVPFSGSSQKVAFQYARVRHTDGTVVETSPADVLEQPAPVTREAPFYSDLKTAELPIRGLRVGDTLEWESVVTDIKPEIPGQFWSQESFLTDGITLQENTELRVPLAVHVHVWTNAASTAKLTESTSGDVHTYLWTHSNLKPTVGPVADSQKEADKKKVMTAADELDAHEGKLPDIAWTTFPDWGSVGTWYHGLEAERMQPGATVKAKVAELTAGKASQEEKVQAVYNYVATQIHYIGVAFGIGRYQPHTAEEILANQYGDCKDKHTLLASMLSVLGLQPDAVLIGAQVRFNEAVPAPQSFNHLITRVQVDGKAVWLDATTEVAPYRMLFVTLRDKQALIIPANGPARIERTPADTPFAASENMTAKGSLDKDGTSVSRITLSFRGDTELLLREVARQITPAQYDEFTQRLVGGMGYGGTTSHSEFSRPDDTSQPFTISFDYRREKGGDWDNHRIAAQLEPVDLPVLDPKDPPRQAVDLRAPRTNESHAEMRLPEAWKAELPEAVHAASPFATYDLTFHFDKGLLVADRKVAVLQRYVAVSDWKDYKKWQDTVSLGNEQFIQLTTPAPEKATAEPGSTDADSTASASASPGKVAGADLVEQANHLLQVHALESAQKALDKAQSVNTNVSGLWDSYGFLAFLRGNSEEAIKDYRKELDLHPGDAWAYQQLASLQIATNRHAEAADTLRTWTAEDPNDARPVLLTVNMLLDEGKPAEAVTAGKSGLAHLDPENNRLQEVQIALGRAQIKAGALKDADATLTPLLSSSKPLILNDAAYELADAELELAAAEAAERTALKALEAETASWTLHESTATLAQTSQLLAASWDTMGWILFRQGKFADALAYIQAARRSHHSWEVSEHLGDIEVAQGHKPAALAAYEEADKLLPRVDAMGVRKDPGREAAEIEKKIAGLKSAVAAPAPLSDPFAQASRTFVLGPSKGRSATAEYSLLLSRDKVEALDAVGGKDLPESAALLANFKTGAFFPPDSQARLVVTGFLNCHATVCELVLRP